MRDMSNQEIKPIPTKSIKIERPKITNKSIKTNMYGIDINISTIRIIILSILPPK